MTDRPWPPTPGTYIYRALVKRLPNGRWLRGPAEPCRIWYGPPLDPLTLEEMDRGPDWQAVISGQVVEIDDAWPFVAGEKISLEQYIELLEERVNGHH